MPFDDLISYQRKADSGKLSAGSYQQTAESGKRKAESRQRKADSGQRTADSRQQKARQQKADSGQPTAQQTKKKLKQMKYIFTILLGLMLMVGNSQIQKDSISMGNNYTNQIFYSLDNGVIADIDNNDWDIGFACSGNGAAGSAIIINEVSMTLWSYPGDTSAWTSFDTIGHLSWERLLNSDTTWTNGAFNAHRGSNGMFDMGWGVLNPQNNFWTFGDSIYLAQIGADKYKKIWIVSLKSGVWEVKYADIDGSNEHIIIIDKEDYPNVNFAYLDLQTNETKNREPENNTWDIQFTKHQDEVVPGLIIPVTSVFSNRGLMTAKSNLSNYSETIEAQGVGLHPSEKINNIGREWKKFKSATGWAVYDSIAYFLYTEEDGGNGYCYYKIVFTGFDGRSTGNVYFDKERLCTVSVENNSNIHSYSIYPNPAQGYTTLLLDSKQNGNATLEIIDISGRLLQSTDQYLHQGFNQIDIDLSNLPKGILIWRLRNESYLVQSKLYKVE